MINDQNAKLKCLQERLILLGNQTMQVDYRGAPY